MKPQFFTVEILGPNTSKTPEGFLLCTGVAIARTGEQTYTAEEMQREDGSYAVEPGPDGLVHITRTREEVFRDTTLASANGKSFCLDHPDDDVKPHNWQTLSHGVMFYPRQGENEFSEQMLAELLITTEAGIADVEEGLARDGKVELSCGYDSEYEDDGGGRGRQVNIIINHVAKVDRGRCGPVCSIKDNARPARTGDSDMPKTFTERLTQMRSKVADCDKPAMDELAAAHDAEVAEAEKKEKDKAKDGEGRLEAMESRMKECEKTTADHAAKIKTHDEDIKGLKEKLDESEESEAEQKSTEDALEEEAPDGMGDKARKAKDSALLDDSFQSTISLAEIIAPGLHHPTFDKAMEPKKTYDAMCNLRRKAISVANATTEGATMIAELRGGRVLTADGLRTMDCGTTRSLFLSLGTAKKRVNAADSGSRSHIADPNAGAAPKLPTLKELNERNRKL